jgi:hypothetical protein
MPNMTLGNCFIIVYSTYVVDAGEKETGEYILGEICLYAQEG